MKKFNNCRNVIGNLVKKHREEKHYTKADLSHKLELLSIELDHFELYYFNPISKVALRKNC